MGSLRSVTLFRLLCMTLGLLVLCLSRQRRLTFGPSSHQRGLLHLLSATKTPRAAAGGNIPGFTIIASDGDEAADLKVGDVVGYAYTSTGSGFLPMCLSHLENRNIKTKRSGDGERLAGWDGGSHKLQEG
ncbi:hypothetical protein QBC33DRAFT_519522 [Phialemonium atrogriseum]|uniref:Uncharacterized protein n=1 Tax=Phialemonium atrogriseum TaxID=1093897 RepID=A0AAJ0BSS9_9PEZI|nr:uncharacterized protein QBC33DRAFT_519522 [Phialemonium atrogriseum]KAK1762439.1 hypothetical protein QBC33DRAFT_519522 [Phialemonium atrogriseum]